MGVCPESSDVVIQSVAIPGNPKEICCHSIEYFGPLIIHRGMPTFEQVHADSVTAHGDQYPPGVSIQNFRKKMERGRIIKRFIKALHKMSTIVPSKVTAILDIYGDSLKPKSCETGTYCVQTTVEVDKHEFVANVYIHFYDGESVNASLDFMCCIFEAVNSSHEPKPAKQYFELHEALSNLIKTRWTPMFKNVDKFDMRFVHIISCLCQANFMQISEKSAHLVYK